VLVVDKLPERPWANKQRKGVAMDQIIRWAVLAVVVYAGLFGAYMFRYEPLPSIIGDGGVAVWDRWGHRVCLTGNFKGQRLECPRFRLEQEGEP